MNNASEHDIDRVLTALRDTQPSAGLESRILQAIESRTPARSAWFRWTSPIQWSLAALATASVVIAIVLTAHNTHRATPAIAESQVPTPVSPALPPQKHVILPAKKYVILSSAKDPLSPRIRPNSQYPPHELLCDCDPLAMAEMQAPSQPAPPMPLTAQERLLQRVVHHGDPIEIAELEPLPATIPLGQDADLQRVVQGYLKQLAAAEALNPTPPTSDSNDPAPDMETPN